MKTLVQAVSLRQRLSEETWVRSQASTYICGGHYSNKTCFSSRSLGIPSQHYCTNTPYTYSFIYFRHYILLAK